MRAVLIITSITAALALIAPGAAMADTNCPAADLVPTPATLAPAAVATVCLINEQRAAAGLAPVSIDMGLTAVSGGYARRMVAEGFFAHVAPDGNTLEDRLGVIGYHPEMAGENIFWGESPRSTPAEAVDAWAHSPEHRENMLDPAFREIGIGIAIGAPKAGTGPAATYVTDFDDGAAVARASTVADAPTSAHLSVVHATHPRRAVAAWFDAARTGNSRAFCHLQDNRLLASEYGSAGGRGLRTCGAAFQAVPGLPTGVQLRFARVATRAGRSSVTVVVAGRRVRVELRKFDSYWKLDSIAR